MDRKFCLHHVFMVFSFLLNTRKELMPHCLKSIFSSFSSSSVTVQAGMCQTKLETPKRGFLMMWCIHRTVSREITYSHLLD